MRSTMMSVSEPASESRMEREKLDGEEIIPGNWNEFDQMRSREDKRNLRCGSTLEPFITNIRNFTIVGTVNRTCSTTD